MFTTPLYAFSQPLYHVCADFAQHIGIDTCFHADFLLGLFSDLEDGVDMFLRNFG
jgi:hypothetical protein